MDTMTKRYNLFNDRRKSLRKPFKAPVTLRLSNVIKGSGSLKDITIDSACIVAPELFAFLRPEQSDIFQDAELAVCLPREALNIRGKIIRVSPFENELAITILQTSNHEKWMELCR